MNIFVLDNDPANAAAMHCDKHVVKMVLETAQILSTVHHLHDSPIAHKVYKPTHKNHPCVKWAAESSDNYRWLAQLFTKLAYEYSRRYDKAHKSQREMWRPLMCLPFVFNNESSGKCTPFALAMPDVYKFVSDDPVECYRAYYWHEKRDLLKYTRREEPEWLTKMRAQAE